METLFSRFDPEVGDYIDPPFEIDDNRRPTYATPVLRVWNELEYLHPVSSDQLPEKLWRVQCSDSQARVDHRGDLVAKGFFNLESIPRLAHHRLQPQTLDNLLCSHLQWGHRPSPSCFISVFDDYDVAEQWAMARSRFDSKQPPPKIYEVHPEELDLDQSALIKIEPLAKLDLYFEELFGLELKRDVSHEYVVLNYIPKKALGRCVELESKS